MNRLIPLSEFGTPDPYFRNRAAEGRSLSELLQDLRTDVESIEISPYLHPSVEEYVYRVLNTYLHGWFYYPLFAIAENLSIFNLEQALKVRYEFQSSPRTTLNDLLRNASNSDLLRFKQTETVKNIYEARKENHPLFEAMGVQVQKPNINDIAQNRRKIVTENLPAIRGYIVHPTIPSVTMPHNALIGIKQHVEYINIIAENSDAKLRKLLSSVDFDWSSAKYIPIETASNTFSRDRPFTHRKSIQVIEIIQFIDEVVVFLGLEKRCPADQLWVLSRYSLVPSKAYKILDDIFRNNKDLDSIEITDPVELAEIIKFEDYSIGLLQDLGSSFMLNSGGLEVQFEFIRTSSTRKQWKVTTIDGQKTKCCSVKRHEYSYHILNKLSLQSKLENSISWHLGILRKVIGGEESDNRQYEG